MTDIDRAEKGRFVKGHGVRGGRRVGLSEGEKIRNFLEPKKEEVLTKLAELAALGDPRSQQLFLAYVAPPMKPEAERVSIPNFSSATTMQERAEAVIAAAASGHCSAEAAERLLRVLSLYAQAVTTTQLEERLAAVEQGRVLVPAADIIDNEPKE